MRIAITQRVVETAAYPDSRDALSQDWPRFFADCLPQAAVLPVPNRPQGAAAWMAEVRPTALVLSNGNDWGEAPERDQTEQLCFETAMEMEIPVLGVCRGLQVLNVLHGGRLQADIATVTGIEHVNEQHSVDICADWATSLAGTNSLTVNSYHDMGVLADDLASAFRPFAMAGRGVEGLFHPQHPVLGMLWHPEREDPAAAFNRQLIGDFLAGRCLWL